MNDLAKISEAERLEKLEIAAQRAQKLRSLQEHPGWQEMMDTLQTAQEMLDKNLLAQARSGTLTEREINRYEDTTRAYKLFRENPEKAIKALDTLLKKERAQSDEGAA